MISRIDRVTDWIVERVSPRHAAQRAHFRRMAADPQYAETIWSLLHARGYRAAASGKSSTPWLGSDGSADSHISQDLPKLRCRSRELDRDDPIGGGIFRTFVQNVIGTGLRPQARTDDRDKNARIEAVWNERKNNLYPADGLDHGASQRLRFKKVLEDGEVLIKESKDPADPHAPLFFEIIESDRLAAYPGVKPLDGNVLHDGVEKSRITGIPQAYHILNGYPGDMLANSFGLAGAASTTRVPADQVKHLKVTARPGQTRGVPLLHAVLQDLRDLDLLMLAALKRTQIAACLALFIKSDNKMTDMLSATAEKYGYRMDDTIEPGMMYKLTPGEEIQTLIPNFPVPEFGPFIVTLCRRIGASVGVCWQMVLRDFSGSNYSSARSDLLESRQTFLVYQDWFREQMLSWEWTAVLADARLRGDARLRDCSDSDLAAVAWIANGWKWVDPLKEAKATEIALKSGAMTLRDVCAAQGKDWEEELAQRAIEIAMMRALGISASGEDSQVSADAIGKVPLALQQLALTKERIKAQGDGALEAQLAAIMDQLMKKFSALLDTAQLSAGGGSQPPDDVIINEGSDSGKAAA